MILVALYEVISSDILKTNVLLKENTIKNNNTI